MCDAPVASGATADGRKGPWEPRPPSGLLPRPVGRRQSDGLCTGLSRPVPVFLATRRGLAGGACVVRCDEFE